MNRLLVPGQVGLYCKRLVTFVASEWLVSLTVHCSHVQLQVPRQQKLPLAQVTGIDSFCLPVVRFLMNLQL